MCYKSKAWLLQATLFILCLPLIAQEVETPIQPSSEWILQGSVSALKTGRSLNANGMSMSDSDLFDQREMIEVPSNGFMISSLLQKQVGKRIYLGTGVNMMKYEYESLDIPAGGGESIDPRLGFVYVNGKSGYLSYNVGYYYVGVPLNAMAKLGDGTIKFISELSLSPTYLIGYEYKSKLVYDYVSTSDRKDKSDVQVPAFNLFAGVSTGLEYQMFSDLAFALQVQCMQSLLDVSTVSFRESLNGFGIKFSMAYTLNYNQEIPEELE